MGTLSTISAAAMLLGPSVYQIEQAEHGKRVASQKADAAKIDTAHAAEDLKKKKEAAEIQAANAAILRRQRGMAGPTYGQATALTGLGAAPAGKTALGA